jgi:opine dehydrogenase
VARSIERIAVLGAGPGGLAAAAALAHRGRRVTLYNRSSDRIQPIHERGGVDIEGGYGEAFVPLAAATTDPAAAFDEADLFLVAAPAYAQVSLVEKLIPFLRPGRALVLLSGSGGSLEVAPLLRKVGLDPARDVLVGETVSLPQSGRMIGPAKVRIRLAAPRTRGAAFPGIRTAELAALLQDVIPLNARPNVLDPALNNPNFLIHPAPMLLNYAAVERAQGALSIMNEGMTPAVLRCLDAVDAEKMAVARAFGLDPISIDDFYREIGSGPHVYRQPGEPFDLKDRIWPRYVTEDVPYGTVLISALGSIAGVPTPLCDGITHVLSVAEGTDFWAQGRGVQRLGLAGLTKTQVIAYVTSGERPN